MPLRVSHTSALVLLWAGRSPYKSERALKFLDRVDLSAGKKLWEEFNSVFNSYDEIILNRKFGVRYFWNNFLQSRPDSQVILLAAGLDPISLDIADQFPEAKIFEVDLDNMGLKERLVKELGGPESIRFCSVSLTETDKLTEVLIGQGWDKESPTLLIAEGVSYYVAKIHFQKTLSALKTPKGGLIFEFGIPFETVALGWQSIPLRIFGKLERDFRLPPVSLYSIREVQTLAGRLGVSDKVIILDQTELEKRRKGRAEIFAEPDSGWINVAFIPF